MKLGGRSIGRILRAPLQAGHYRAAAGMLMRYPDPIDSSRRFLTGRGAYPHRPRVRTPIGIVAPTLYSPDDMATVNEVFCRVDYRAPKDLRVAVDVGSNIGISVLYFLTRNSMARVYAFEPDPKNTERLGRNLEGYEDRYVLEEVAVSLSSGTAEFGVEPVGRYGTLDFDAPTGHPATERIEVRMRAIGEVVEGVLAREDRIDILKVDVEGGEEQLVAALGPVQLDRIDRIVYETNAPAPLHRQRYSFHYSCQTNRLDRLT